MGTPLHTSLFICLSILGAVQALYEDHSCIFFDGDPGWRCGSGECHPKHWICDSNTQCEDNSDETLGCNLFNDTGCNSWQGKRYVKCPNSPHRCVENIETDCPDETNQDLIEIGKSSCPPNPTNGGEQWRCNDGLCISLTAVCDGHGNCQDRSDETEGCNLFPETSCRSWYGQRHITCDVNGTSVCTLPEFELAETCRKCSEDPDRWRCNNGLCIPKQKLMDGIPDCIDGSDEESSIWKWWIVLIVTLVFTVIGILFSYLYRSIIKKSCFSCPKCQNLKKSKRLSQRISKSCQSGLCHDTVDDKTLELEDEEGVLPLKLLHILEEENLWRKRSFVGTSNVQSQGKALYAQIHQNPVLYQNLYHYLVYRYSTSENLGRIVELLRRWELDFHGGDALECVKCWRLQLGMSYVLKHVLKSIQPPGIFSKIYEKFIFPIRNISRQQRKKLNDVWLARAEKVYTVVKTVGLLFRPFFGASALYFDIFKDIAIGCIIFKSLADLSKNEFFSPNHAFEMALPSVFFIAIILVQISFMLISAYYATDIFETCDHTNTSKKVFFRTMLFILGPFMPVIILANHVFYSEQEHTLRRDLETCDSGDELGNIKATCKTSLFQKIQRTQYKSHLYRRIYSFYRVTEAAMESMSLIVVLVLILIVCPRPNRAINLHDGVQSKIGDFLGIKTADYEEGLSPTRDETFLQQLGLAKDVVFGVSIVYSFIMIITAFVRYVYQCKGKNVTFVGQFFLGLYFACHTVTRLTVTIAMFSTAEDSGIVEETDPNLAISNPPTYRRPVVSVFPAAILALCLFIFHFLAIYYFKWSRIKEFRESNKVEQIVHVLLNTVVVVPFMNWDIGIRNDVTTQLFQQIPEQCDCLKRSKSQDHLLEKLVVPFKKGHRRCASDTTGMREMEPVCTVNSRPGSKQKLDELDNVELDESVNMVNETLEITENTTTDSKDSKKLVGWRRLKHTKTLLKSHRSIRRTVGKEPSLDNKLASDNFFDMNTIFGSYIGVKRKIVEFWWEDPTRDLTEEMVVDHFSKFTNKNDVKKKFRELVNSGFINRKLFNPRRTKTEYFWLLILQLIINLFALGIEVANGGIQTNKGLYYSWDVRLSSFFLGLVFLVLYYKKYHLLHELTGLRCCGFCWDFMPVFLFFRKDKAMTAIPESDELERLLKASPVGKAATNVGTGQQMSLPPKSIETQTSFIDVSQKRIPTDSLSKCVSAECIDSKTTKDQSDDTANDFEPSVKIEMNGDNKNMLYADDSPKHKIVSNV